MLTNEIIRRSLRVPRADGAVGDGADSAVVARQFDAVLVQLGFTASAELLAHVGSLPEGQAIDVAASAVTALRGLVGDDVEHNAYFIDFPRNVPDTVAFWAACLYEAVATHGIEPSHGWVDLLTLPKYGRYQHTHAELLAAHDELVASVGDRLTVVHLGGTLAEETAGLYATLAASVTPLGAGDLALLGRLADVAAEHPTEVPVRESRAVVNAARLSAGLPLVGVDTVVDVLRVACHASGGDLDTPTRFRSFARRERRVLLEALDRVVAGDGAGGKLGDVHRHAEIWKRLAVGLHPYEYRLPDAQAVFAVARGERTVRSLPARAEQAMRDGRVAAAATVLTAAPGLLVRSLDRLLRTGTDTDVVLAAFESVVDSVAGRVLCSVREHVDNRAAVARARVFPSRSKRAWTTVDARLPLPHEVVARVRSLVDAELARRLADVGPVVVDPAVLDVALPLSGKASEDGFAVLPRGSRTAVTGDVLRFFAYWREQRSTTDFDLSALLLDDEYRFVEQVSWTNLTALGVVHSGDLTTSAGGATEFIDVPLAEVPATRLVPQVNVYSGEGFDHVAESMFGWMLRGADQAGAPFEARTVRTRSDMRGAGRVALPAVFSRAADGTWSAVWTHLYLRGTPRFNRVETNMGTASEQVRAIVERRYLTVRYLLDLLPGPVTEWTPDLAVTEPLTEPLTYVGVTVPDGLPAGTTVLDLATLNRLVPA